MFGAGADLCVAGQCQTGMECYSNMPHSYSGENASSSILMGDYNFNVLDYEVFTLADLWHTHLLYSHYHFVVIRHIFHLHDYFTPGRYIDDLNDLV